MNINEALTRYAVEILPSKEVFLKTLSSKKLTFYHGVDPTGPDLHLGHSTNYLLMRTLQDAGHKVILLIGDFTARIGDPSDKSAARKKLGQSEIDNNLKNYKKQVAKILSFNGKNPALLKFNSSWLAKLSFADVIELASELTVQQMIERDIFQKRLAEKKPLYVHEFLYPLAQGYDSVALKTDAEIGGSDQTFNMLVGRALVKKYLGKNKFTISTKLLVNPKTKKKLMSKSEGGYIALNDNPNEMYGKVMALADENVNEVFNLCTMLANDDIKSIIKTGPLKSKQRLAWELVKLYHSKKDAGFAHETFLRTFQKKEPEYKIEAELLGTLAQTIAPFTNLASISAAKRLIKEGAIDINGEVVTDTSYKPQSGDKIKIGKTKFVTIK